MRNLCILTMILLLAACTKETEEESFMRYTFKGKEIRHTGSFQSFQATGNSGVYVQKSHSPLPPDVYLIEGISGMYNRITVVLATDSLTPGAYASGGDPLRAAVGIQMSAGFNNGYLFGFALYNRASLQVQVTKHSAGRASGTFSGRVYRPASGSSNPSDSSDISGEFNNLEVRYQ